MKEDLLPVIQPVPSGVHRPVWSVMIPTYNCAEYLRQTLSSVLEQDPGPDKMQIEVVDDCSTRDDPESVVLELGNGRVGFFRQPQNVGATRNFNTCIQRSRGKIIHILHGDDYVRSGFYAELEAAFGEHPDIGAAYCRFLIVDEKDRELRFQGTEGDSPQVLTNWLERIAVVQLIQFPAIVVRRSVYEQLGGFHIDLSHSADWEMWRRIAANFPVWYTPNTLACYRVHSGSHSSQLARKGKNIADIRQSIYITREYLPDDLKQPLSRAALDYYANASLESGHHYLANNDPSAAFYLAIEAVRCRQSRRVLISAAHLTLSALWAFLRQR